MSALKVTSLAETIVRSPRGCAPAGPPTSPVTVMLPALPAVSVRASREAAVSALSVESNVMFAPVGFAPAAVVSRKSVVIVAASVIVTAPAKWMLSPVVVMSPAI